MLFGKQSKVDVSRKYRDYLKVVKVVRSCTTPVQLRLAAEFAYLYCNYYRESPFLFDDYIDAKGVKL